MIRESGRFCKGQLERCRMTLKANLSVIFERISTFETLRRDSIVFVCDRLVREKQIFNYSKGNRKHAMKRNFITIGL